MGHGSRDKKRRTESLKDRVMKPPLALKNLDKKQQLKKKFDSEVISYNDSMNREVKVSAIDIGRSFVESMFTLSSSRPFRIRKVDPIAQKFIVQLSKPLPVKVVTQCIEKALIPLVKKDEL